MFRRDVNEGALESANIFRFATSRTILNNDGKFQFPVKNARNDRISRAFGARRVDGGSYFIDAYCKRDWR